MVDFAVKHTTQQCDAGNPDEAQLVERLKVLVAWLSVVLCAWCLGAWVMLLDVVRCAGTVPGSSVDG